MYKKEVNPTEFTQCGPIEDYFGVSMPEIGLQEM